MYIFSLVKLLSRTKNKYIIPIKGDLKIKITSNRHMCVLLAAKMPIQVCSSAGLRFDIKHTIYNIQLHIFLLAHVLRISKIFKKPFDGAVS